MNESGFLDHEGCRLHFQVRGEGPPVVLVQGVGVHGDGWLPQVDVLASRFRCLWFDNRGMGRSLPAPAALTVAQMVSDTRALIDAQGWPSAHVIGHSLGGLVALVLALESPARVRSLALLCTFARGRDAGNSARMIWLGTRSRLGTRRMRRHAFLEMVLPPGALAGADRDRLAQELAATFGHDLADHGPVEGLQLAAMKACDTTAELERLAGTPTLVVSAEHDPIAPPPLGVAITHGIPGARFVLLHEASHGVPVAEPERINELLIGHLESIEARGRHPHRTLTAPLRLETTSRM